MIFGPNTDEVTGECKRLQNQELYVLHSLNFFRVIRSRIMRFAGNVARMGDKRSAYRFLGRGHFEDLDLDGRIILKWLLICSISRVSITYLLHSAESFFRS